MPPENYFGRRVELSVGGILSSEGRLGYCISGRQHRGSITLLCANRYFYISVE